ncbi:MAG TPA: pirin family protein [Herbaspirillum sp.]
MNTPFDTTSLVDAASQAAPVAPALPGRDIVLRSPGHRHGPVTRLFSPGDIGGLIKPFVFLDHFDLVPGASGFPMHPHSGIATVSVLLSGAFSYEDTTGASGTLGPGGVEWMQAGNGVWHVGDPVGSETLTGYQVWVALPQERENGPAQSQYVAPEDVPDTGAARVILGSHGGMHSKVLAPAGMNLLHVRLADGQAWRYQPPVGHAVAWTHVRRGRLLVAGQTLENELAVFGESEQALEFVALGDAEFILGSAIKHPHALALGNYSVHTSPQALARGEAEIRRIGQQLREQGRI